MPFRRFLRSLKSRLCIICCVGHLGQGGSGAQNQMNQDGYISALILTFILCAFGISLSIAQWSAKLEELSEITILIKIIFIIFMFISICFMVHFFKSPPEFTEQTEPWLLAQMSVGCSLDDNVDERSCSWRAFKTFVQKTLIRIRRLFKYKVAIVGLSMFWIVGILVDVIKIAALMECIDDIEKSHLTWYIVDAVFHLFRPAFFGVVLAFAIKFHNAHFQGAKQVWYLISFILATAIIMWFDVILHEILHGTTERDLSIPLTKIIPGVNDTLPQNKTTSCLERRSSIYRFYLKSSNFFYALNVEFLVLAVEVLIHILYNIHHGIAHNSSPPPPRVTLQHSSTSFSYVQMSQSDPLRCGYLKVLIAIFHSWGVLIDVALVTLAILTYFSIYDPFRIMSFFFRFSLIIFILIGYQSCADFSSRRRSLSGYEYLVVFSATGSHVFAFISIYGEIAWWLKYNDKAITQVSLAFGFLANVINILAAYLQSTFYIHCSRLKAVNLNSRSYAWFKACLLNIAVCNLALWVVDSFVLNQNLKATLIPKQYYSSSWDIITHLTIPFALFYRFNCFALYLRTYFLQNSYQRCEETEVDIQDNNSSPSHSRESVNTVSETLSETPDPEQINQDQILDNLV